MFLPQFIYKQGLHLCIYSCKNLTEITCCTAHFTQRWTLLKFVVFMYAMFFRTCMAYFRLLPTVAQYSSIVFSFFLARQYRFAVSFVSFCRVFYFGLDFTWFNAAYVQFFPVSGFRKNHTAIFIFLHMQGIIEPASCNLLIKVCLPNFYNESSIWRTDLSSIRINLNLNLFFFCSTKGSYSQMRWYPVFSYIPISCNLGDRINRIGNDLVCFRSKVKGNKMSCVGWIMTHIFSW